MTNKDGSLINFNFQPGDTFLTRNEGEENNESPGYWNHCAIYIGDEKIVEAQVEPYNKVMYSHLGEFIQRYPNIKVLRHPNPDTALLAASNACKSVGRPYWRGGSIFRNLRSVFRGENCVSVIRRAWFLALRFDPRWHRPDHVLTFGFKIVAEKREK